MRVIVAAFLVGVSGAAAAGGKVYPCPVGGNVQFQSQPCFADQLKARPVVTYAPVVPANVRVTTQVGQVPSVPSGGRMVAEPALTERMRRLAANRRP